MEITLKKREAELKQALCNPQGVMEDYLIR